MLLLGRYCCHILQVIFNCFFWMVDRGSQCISQKSTALILLVIFALLAVRQFTFLENNYYLLPPFTDDGDEAEDAALKRPEDTFDWTSQGKPAETSYPLLGGKTSTTVANGSLLILLWTEIFGYQHWGLGEDVVDGGQPYQSANCPVSNCYVTRDRSRLQDASAVLVHFRDDFKYSDRPAFRPPNQYWVFVLWESPEHTYSWHPVTSRTSKRFLRTDFKSFFNWTMTYRLDSDIPMHYGRFDRRLNDKPSYELSRNNKSRTAVALMSNCRSTSHREECIRELQRYIDVEVIGHCSTDEIQWLFGPNQQDLPICQQQVKERGTPDECLRFMESNFRFYLAFENSLCRDYVTEKFFRAASLNLIPVVMNAANMSLFAPPHSYINAADFKSPRHLARYLKKVADDEQLYNSYFWWKPYYEPSHYWDRKLIENSFCQLCLKLNEARRDPVKHAKIYDDLEGWWIGDGRCQQGTITPNQRFRNFVERTVVVLLIPIFFIVISKCLAKLMPLFLLVGTNRPLFSGWRRASVQR